MDIQGQKKTSSSTLSKNAQRLISLQSELHEPAGADTKIPSRRDGTSATSVVDVDVRADQHIELGEAGPILRRLAENRRRIRAAAEADYLGKRRAQQHQEEALLPITQKIDELGLAMDSRQTPPASSEAADVVDEDPLGTPIQNFTAKGRHVLAQARRGDRLAEFAAIMPPIDQRRAWLRGAKGDSIRNAQAWARMVWREASGVTAARLGERFRPFEREVVRIRAAGKKKRPVTSRRQKQRPDTEWETDVEGEGLSGVSRAPCSERRRSPDQIVSTIISSAFAGNNPLSLPTQERFVSALDTLLQERKISEAEYHNILKAVSSFC